jgi:hypothetical protein
MRYLLTFAAAAALAFAGAAKKNTPVKSEAGNETVNIYATLLADKDHIREALGAELPAGIVAVQVSVAPRGEEALNISRDDFQIISHKDGQRSGPFVPSQIAGSATLVVRSGSQGGGMYSGNPNAPVWGGIPGTMGRPRQIGTGDGGAIGAGGGSETETTARQASDPKQKDNPLLTLLEQKMLPDKETNETVNGFLYFPLDGKHKPKHLELIYNGPAGRLFVDFNK